MNRFLLACAATSEDPVELIQTAAQERIPADPRFIVPDTTVESSAFANRKTIEEIVDEIKSDEDFYQEQIADRRVFDEKQARLGAYMFFFLIAACLMFLSTIGELSRPLPEEVKLALESSRKVTNLYLHQTNAINALWENKHVIVSTSTASGKSVIYQVRLTLKSSAVRF